MQTFYILFLGILLISTLIGFLWTIWYLLGEFKQIISGYGIPFVPTPDYKMQILLENIHLKEGQVFLDIGCGDGKILQFISEKYPDNLIIGYERSSRPYNLAVNRKKQYQCNYTVFNSDFFGASLKNIDVIYSYMMPHLMEKIWKKINSECRPGTLFYSNSFPIDSVAYSRIIECERNQKIYLYIV